MKPSFKKRSIEELVRRARSLLLGPAFLKFFSLLMLFGAALFFQLRAENLQGRSPRLDAPPSEARSGAPPWKAFPVLSSSPLGLVPKKEIPSGRININTAPVEELASLPGVGPKLAEEIDMYRHQKGPFHEAGDLLAVRGIGPRRARRIAPYLNFGGSS